MVQKGQQKSQLAVYCISLGEKQCWLRSGLTKVKMKKNLNIDTGSTVFSDGFHVEVEGKTETKDNFWVLDWETRYRVLPYTER